MFDTIAGYVYEKLNIQLLMQKGWNYWEDKDNFKSRFVYNGNNVFICYYPLSEIFWFQTSIPKIIFGTNTIMAFEKDIPTFDMKFTKIINNLTGMKFSSILDFNVSRCDFCYNFIVNNAADKIFYINMFKNLYFPRLKLVDYDTTSFFYCKSYSIKLYDKLEELIYSKCSILSETDSSYIDKILRFEVEYKREKIKYEFGKTTTFRHILKDTIAVQHLMKYLNADHLNRPYYTIDKIKNILTCEYNNRIKSSKAIIKTKETINKLIKFIKTINKNSFSKTIKLLNISKKTANRYMEILAKLNINLFLKPRNRFKPINLNISLKIIQSLCSQPIIHNNIKIINRITTPALGVYKRINCRFFPITHQNRKANTPTLNVEIFIPSSYFFEDGG